MATIGSAIHRCVLFFRHLRCDLFFPAIRCMSSLLRSSYSALTVNVSVSLYSPGVRV